MEAHLCHKVKNKKNKKTWEMKYNVRNKFALPYLQWQLQETNLQLWDIKSQLTFFFFFYFLEETGFYTFVPQQEHCQCERTSQTCCCLRMWCEKASGFSDQNKKNVKVYDTIRRVMNQWCSVVSHSTLKMTGSEPC